MGSPSRRQCKPRKMSAARVESIAKLNAGRSLKRYGKENEPPTPLARETRAATEELRELLAALDRYEGHTTIRVQTTC